jgi:hypothetical protein
MDEMKKMLETIKVLLKDEAVKKFSIDMGWEMFGDYDDFITRPKLSISVEKNVCM